MKKIWTLHPSLVVLPLVALIYWGALGFPTGAADNNTAFKQETDNLKKGQQDLDTIRWNTEHFNRANEDLRQLQPQ